MEKPLLELKNLETCFFIRQGIVRASDKVSWTVKRGETLGVVGESGCGKSITALSIMRQISLPGRITGGKILYKGKDLLDIPSKQMPAIRGKEISMIFQEPMTSLNPVFSIRRQISETIIKHQQLKKKDAIIKSIEMLEMVGIAPAEKRINDYPHMLSGGQRQRVMIAIALSCEPTLLIADEPTTALDVTIQAQIMDLILKLKKETGTSMILISHDLGLIAEMAQQVAVMYAGKVVEEGDVYSIFERPLHPYTQGLLKSIPYLRINGEDTGERNKLNEIPGFVPSLLHLPRGCRFASRCSNKKKKCLSEEPPLRNTGKNHFVRCW